MPYPNEYATGESLIWLENSQSLKDFEGVILKKEGAWPQPTTLKVERRGWWPHRVIAIDGSNVIKRINNGFPGAEAGLLLISVISIKLKMLRDIVASKQIPRPSVFHNMEGVGTVEAALPGINVVKRGVDDDSPLRYFRRTVHETLKDARLGGPNTETLLETLRGLSENISPKGKCPGEECDVQIDAQLLKQGKSCPACKEKLYETDILRLHEYYDGITSSGEVHGRFRSAVEVLVLLNILRFFAQNSPQYLADSVFVMDGPLAVFGTPASLLRPIRDELIKINDMCREKTGKDIALFGVEKGGILYEHWEHIDHDEKRGPRMRYPDSSVIAPTGSYIMENVKPSKGDRYYGGGTHFGRFVLYKTNKGEHVVVNTAMLSKASQDLNSDKPECYHRLGDILDVLDHLATYLYTDGFMPLVRAHANAAIPLKRGSDIIQSLFD